MTGREALEAALRVSQNIEVKGKQNILNLGYVIQLLEALKDMDTKENSKEPEEADVNG